MNRQLLLQSLDESQELIALLYRIYKSCDAEVHPATSMALHGLVSQSRGIYEVLTSVVMTLNSEQYTQGE